MRATSTITQQLARTVFLNNSRSLVRKGREAILAMALEWKFLQGTDPRASISTRSLASRRRAYGVDAASRKFFGHPGT
ncbi:MAG: transglycosylase domain-containing protein [Novosphingobium sp.]